MSILIKGMEISKGRPVCVVIDAAWQARRYDLNNDRYADNELFEAVPVPPHGDLIDRDALILRVNMHGTNKFGMLDENIREFIDDAPTIITAEEE